MAVNSEVLWRDAGHDGGMREFGEQHYAPELLNRAPMADDPATQQLLERYLSAWHAADIDQLTRLLREDVVMAMPPSPSWYRGLPAVRAFLATSAFPSHPAIRWHLRATRANGRPAFGVYQASSVEGPYVPFGIQTLLLADGQVREITTFTQPGLLARFGLPPKDSLSSIITTLA